jgi:hypothetical protein
MVNVSSPGLIQSPAWVQWGNQAAQIKKQGKQEARGSSHGVSLPFEFRAAEIKYCFAVAAVGDDCFLMLRRCVFFKSTQTMAHMLD